MSRVRLLDTLVNLVTGLGTTKDPSSVFSTSYQLNLLQRDQLESMYRGDWLARKIVDAVPEDATREWRSWQAGSRQIESIEELEKTHEIQKKMRQALVRSRLYGGAALVIGVDDGKRSDEPIDLEAVGKSALKFVVVLNRYELMAGPRIYDVMSPWYTRPEYYTVATPLFGFDFEGNGLSFPAYSQPENVVPLRRPGQVPLLPRSSSGPAPGEQGDDPRRSETGRVSPNPLQRGDPARQVTPVSGMVRIHPSRVVEFWGNELPDWRLAPMGGGWGDSVLQTADDALRDYGLTIGGLSAMVSDSKMDVVSIPNFSKNIATKEYAQRLIQRFQLANVAKSVTSTLLLDAEEKWDRKETHMAGAPNMIREMLQVACASGGLPMSRAVGQSQGRGLGAGSSGGEQDLHNYYDDVASKQKTVYSPAMEPLDQVMVRSALGRFDPSVHYEWDPLWQLDEKEKSAIGYQKAQTTQLYVGTGLINEDAMRDAVVNQMTEDGLYPGIEDAIDEHGAEPDVPEARLWSPGLDPRTGLPIAGASGGASAASRGSAAPAGGRGGASPPAPPPPSGGRQPSADGALRVRPIGPTIWIRSTDGGRLMQDAAPRTLYVRRDVLNGADIVRWARRQGFPTTIDAGDMHVTIAYSRQPVDWMRTGSDWSGPPGSEDLVVPAGGARLLDKFGDAVVLLFNSSSLRYRHDQIGEAGASWDHDDYQPHVSITWQVGDFDWRAATPYRGEIRLGPEIFEEIDEDGEPFAEAAE